jgi:hypothetical protein
MKKEEKMICRNCEEEIQLAVCSSYVVLVCEDGDEYECLVCYDRRRYTELAEERYARKVLERILKTRHSDIERG